MLNKQISEKEIEDKLLSDPLVRKEITRQDIYWFFRTYFPHYITYQIAPFQIEILKLLQDDSAKRVAITAFRNSGKSTFCSMVAPIWYIVGALQKKYVILVCQNQERAKQVLSNIKKELEIVGLLSSDYGSFIDQNAEWTANTIVLQKYDARITVLSIGEGIRGVRHGQYRPDVIIVDDVEDVQSAKQKESRDKLWQFVNGELIPAGITDVKVIFIGNLVHEDSLMMRLKKTIQGGLIEGSYKSYPLYDDEKNIFWPGKFPSFTEIEKLRNRIPSENDYQREYLLKIVPQEDRIIHQTDIKYYDPLKSLEFMENTFSYFAISIDPAVSEKNSADKSGIIVYKVYGSGKNLKVYIQPHPINKRLTVPNLIEEVKKIIASFGKNPVYKVFIEGGSTQKGIFQVLQHEGIPAEEVVPQGMDKYTRLSMAKSWISNGVFLFPNKGAEELIDQLLFFGTERYDDLVDSLTVFFLKTLDTENQPTGNVTSVHFSNLKRSPLRNHSNDWDEVEDRQMFRSLGWKSPNRIIG